MEHFQRMAFKDLKSQIANAIKESCYYTEVRLYNIAHGVHHIPTFSLVPGQELAQDLIKIIDVTIKDSVGVGCDLSIIVKGILLGAFRAFPFIRQEAQMTIRLLANEILKPVFKYKGDTKEAIEGLLSGTITITKEFKLNVLETIVVAREDILSSAQAISPQFADEIKEIFLNLNDS